MFAKDLMSYSNETSGNQKLKRRSKGPMSALDITQQLRKTIENVFQITRQEISE